MRQLQDYLTPESVSECALELVEGFQLEELKRSCSLVVIVLDCAETPAHGRGRKLADDDGLRGSSAQVVTVTYTTA